MSEAIPDAGPQAAGEVPAPDPATRSRSVVQKAQRLPLPRRLIALAVLFAALTIALDALPRPYEYAPVSLLLSLQSDYAALGAVYAAQIPALEPVAGEADSGERSSIVWSLRRHRLGLFRELTLRLSIWIAGCCF